jgi:dihydroflavonol-4-reductase
MFRQMRKAGIIGGLEFIGSYMTLKFLSENYRVKVPVSNFKTGEKVLNIPGLLANNNLEEFHGDLHELSGIRNFMSDCDAIIHCGAPISLNKRNKEPQLFVPEIRGTGSLLKVLNEFPTIQKLIFISPPANFNSTESSYPTHGQGRLKTKKSDAKNRINLQSQKAVYHAIRVQENVLHALEDKRLEVIFVSPSKVLGNTLVSSRDSTSAGLKYLFEKEINPDPVFKRVLQQIKLKTLIPAENAAEVVFDKVNSTVLTEMEFFPTTG